MNGIIVVDKPEGWTSHDVVARLRGLLRERRVGHGGTLDPMATGVLPVFVGRATRAVEFCESFDKEYLAGLRLGVVTDTQDTTGRVLAESDASGVSSGDVLKAINRFVGEIEQVPPMYSAVKVGGKRLYDLARQGRTVERAARRVKIDSIELLGREGRDYLLRVVCSKGTYIRTLCHDIGAAIGCGGAMCLLRRTRVGPFVVDRAATVPQLERAAESGGIAELILPVDSLFIGHPAAVARGREVKRCLDGAPFSTELPDGLYRVYGEDGEFLMLGRAEGGLMKTVKSFFEVKS